MDPSVSPSKWAPDEIRRFYRAFCKYGSDFHKISKMVGGGKAPEMCGALWKRHQSYLSLDKKHQSEVAFLALVQDGGATQEPLPMDYGAAGDRGTEGGGYGIGASSMHPHLGGDDDLSDAELAASIPRGRYKSEDDLDDDREASLAADAAAEMVAMASPEKSGQQVEGTLAATRARRTPKRPRQLSPPRAPPSSGKRGRGAASRGGGDDIYEYYDEGITESARKRRAARARLNFDDNAGAAPRGARKGAAVDEKRGIDALLALAVAGTQSGDEGDADVTFDSGPEFLEDDEEEEEDVLGVMLDDERDEDYKAGTREARRRNYSTPNKTRRPGSAHSTPNRRLSSPGGLRSPAWAMDGDFLGDYGDMPYLASPGLPVNFPPGYVPSPKNPMPRLRRRKQAPERTPFLISPLKTLINRRQGLVGNSLLTMGGVNFPGQTQQEDIPTNASPAEIRCRHALGLRLRKFCLFEFFYSALDRPWLMDNAMAELLVHAGLPQSSRLTHKEWSIVRSGLGKPRRLSWAFLRESRARLELHRRSTREFYSQHNLDPALAATLPRQLGVGQKVIARHPITRQLHDGTVLTTANDNYRVQFNRRDLGVEIVRDLDVMPFEPWENLPLTMLALRSRIVVGGRMLMNGRVMPMPVLPPPRMASAQGDAAGATSAAAAPDPSIMAEVATSLDRKEALLVQLRQMNEEACSGIHSDRATGKPNKEFSQAYTGVALKLIEVNDQLQIKLAELDGRTPGGSSFANEMAQEALKLPKELMEEPITSASLGDAALKEAQRFTQACAEKVVANRSEATAAQGLVFGITTPQETTATEMPCAAVAPLVEGAAWTLSLLQMGADKIVPATALATALDNSIKKVKPSSVANAALYTEIEAVINSLKQQLLAH